MHTGVFSSWVVWQGFFERYTRVLMDTSPEFPIHFLKIYTLFEQRLKEWFEYPLGGEFPALVLEAADPQRALRLTARLGNIYPALGLGTVTHPFEAGGEILEICLQIGCVH